MLNNARTQRPYAYPRAGGEFEVLGDATIEQQAVFWMLRVRKSQGITELEKSLPRQTPHASNRLASSSLA